MTDTKDVSKLERLCQERGLRLTDQRRIIARVLSQSDDHPDVETVYRRASDIDPKINISTVYRTLKLLEDANILERHDFGAGRARYEQHSDDHHDHLVDIQSGQVVEFRCEEIERLQKEVAESLGYTLIEHKLELYCIPKKNSVKSHK